MWLFFCIVDGEYEDEFKTELFDTEEEAIEYCADFLTMDIYECRKDLQKFNETREKIYFELKNCSCYILFSDTYNKMCCKIAPIENYHVQEIQLPNSYVLK
jgi:hypothetical protein